MVGASLLRVSLGMMVPIVARAPPGHAAVPTGQEHPDPAAAFSGDASGLALDEWTRARVHLSAGTPDGRSPLGVAARPVNPIRVVLACSDLVVRIERTDQDRSVRHAAQRHNRAKLARP